MAELKNVFTWSASRHGAFHYCKRQYWWNYYGSWGGWSYDGPREAREAYMLKNLANRWTWPGTVVHEAIEAVLRKIASRARQPRLGFDGDPEGGIDIEEEVDKATALMREQWRESRAGHYRRRPKKRFGLAEHEYEVHLQKREWQEANDKARDGLRAFFTSDLFQQIRSSDPRTWLPVETLDQFDFEGTGIWAVLDFAYRDEGGIQIYDWKTGKVKPEANKLQLACYVLYVRARHGAEPGKVDSHLVYLGKDLQAFSFKMSEADLTEARGEIRASIAGMRTRLLDKEGNIARKDDFEMTDDLEKCSICAYRRLCGRA